MTAPVRAREFINYIGIVAQLGAVNGSAKVQAVLDEFAYLGITNIRTPLGALLAQPGSVADKLAQAGIHFDVLIGAGRPLADSLGAAVAFAGNHPGAVTAMEGPNEINNWPIIYNGLSGVNAAVAFEAALAAGVRTAPLLARAALYDFTGAARSDATMRDAAQFANIHPYPQGGAQPYDWTKARILTHAVPGKGIVITESGYTTTPGPSGVDQLTQAKLTLNLLADATVLGSSQTYLYQLFDSGQAGSADAGFGLFDAAMKPKAAATAVHNLTAILADPGAAAAGFAPQALDYTLSGMPVGAHSLLLEKANGTYDLVLWAEPQVWDAAKGQPIGVPASAVTVTLAGGPAEWRLFDPLVSALPQATSHTAAAMTVSISDHPVIVEIAGLTAGTSVAPARFDPPMQLSGTASADTMAGGNGDDVLFGQAGADTIDGGAGNDKIVGGFGGDTLTGGAGADTFALQTLADSKVSPADRDVILDFHAAEGDRIDLSPIDASVSLTGNQAFHLAGDHFTHHAGDMIQTVTGDGLLIQGDLNGDARPDFAILLAGIAHPLGAESFIL